LDVAACAALVEERTPADFYVCGPGPYMDVVRAGLELRGIDSSRVFIERFELPAAEAAASQASETESLVIRLDGRRHSITCAPGDTILDAARRAGLKPPFNCQAGNCATCMAHLDEGKVTMRANNVLSGDEVKEGWVLTCQAIPTSREVVVDYDR
jgi:3-ketosteroid 9alpha-monooxygenase subunit B